MKIKMKVVKKIVWIMVSIMVISSMVLFSVGFAFM